MNTIIGANTFGYSTMNRKSSYNTCQNITVPNDNLTKTEFEESMNNLKSNIENKLKEINDKLNYLTDMIKYMPGGPEMQNAKERFEENLSTLNENE